MRRIVSAKLLTANVQDEMLAEIVPQAAIHRLRQDVLSEQYLLVLRHMGRSKWGHFKTVSGNPYTVISLHNRLLPEAMLVTWLHEFAHLMVWKSHGRKALPHGFEWKDAFTRLAEPYLVPDIFTSDTLKYFAHYLQNPAATATAHPGLYRALTERSDGALALALMPEGSIFSLQGKKFVKGPLRRTRYQCKSPDDGRTYLVNQALWVQAVLTDLSGQRNH